MKTLAWDRATVIGGLRRDIWRYITQASQTEEDLVLFAAALLQMPAAEVRYLAQLQFILSEEVGRLLEQMPFLIRRLTTTTASEVEISAERIRGSIRWSETFAQRAVTGTSHMYVTAPTRRDFDTPENAVLAFALFAIAEFGWRTGWGTSDTSGPAQAVRQRVSEAIRWRQSRALIDLVPRPPQARTISRVRASRSRRRYQAAIDVVDLYQRFIARLDRRAIRDAVEHHALVASRDSVLLELRCAFDAIMALRHLGWKAPPTGLLKPPLIYRARRDDAQLELYFQRTPPALSSGSLYRAVQQTHGFAAVGGLIPDLIIKTTQQGTTRWLLIEVKAGYTRGVAESARAALIDLLGYRRAFDQVLGQQGAYGIGYAWGAELAPEVESEVMLCTPDQLEHALELALA